MVAMEEAAGGSAAAAAEQSVELGGTAEGLSASTNGDSSNGVVATAAGTEHALSSSSKGAVEGPSASHSIWWGTSTFDSWLIAAAAQIGQVVLTLPYSFSQMGYAYGLVFLIFYGLLGAWTVYILTWLYFEFKSRRSLHGKVYPPRHVLQYHEVIGGLTGKWGRYMTFFFVILSLALASVIQLIASASDLYYANDSLNKRQWEYVVGLFALISVIVPSFGHFRVGAIVGVSSTTITGLYLFVASLVHGQVPGVEHVGAVDKVQFFTGATNMLYAFGGHAITIEIMEATRRPSKFKFVYLAVVFYTFAVTIPSAVSTYWAFGDILLHRSNAFAVLPPSPWRTFAIVSIILHQSMVFVLFVHPVFLVCEKFAKVHTRSLGLRILVRIPVVLFLWFVALAIPFFGPINSVMGAFLVTFAVYIIPLVAFFVTYRTKAARQNSAVKLPPFMPSWMLMFLFNGMIVLWIVVVGCGFGGWASVTNFVRQISSFGFFDKCYQC
ncbi:hypothetical protein CY35_04G128400 [Sphagnum magellanicum]|nr:hypothetical protein CY35_04G128400 [Sphagnum magellanicum]